MCRRARFSLLLAFFATLLVPPARAADLEKVWEGKPVYGRVALRFEAGKERLRAASTNFYTYKELFPAGSAFKVTSVSDDSIELTSPRVSRPLVIEYNAKHSQIPFAEFLDRTFSKTPVTLPAGLSAEEKTMIEEGRIAPGMSRRAVFLAIGYPPGSLNASMEARKLSYQRTRFAKFHVNFDAGGKVAPIEGAMSEDPEPTKVDISGKKLYSRVNLRARFDDPEYVTLSTNYIGYSKLFPVGTAFTVVKEGAKAVELRPEGSQTTMTLEYVAEHTQMPLEEFMQRTFSDKKLPLPKSLTAREAELVAAGLIEVGMSRAALFLAAGYPPGNLNPSMDANKLLYMRLPAQKTVVHLAKDKVVKVEM